jgi:hypothetical protein
MTPWILSHSAFVNSRKPLPLHAFCPLQLLVADLQAPWLLQALAPTQRPLASSAKAAGAITAPDRSSVAAATATEAPDRIEIFMAYPFRTELPYDASRGWMARVSIGLIGASFKAPHENVT